MDNINIYLVKLFSALKIPLIFIATLWIIQLVDVSIYHQSLGISYGIVPRNPSRIYGILFSPFLHGSFEHIFGNSVMLLLLSWIICFYDIRLWFKSLIFGIFLGGLFTWFLGSPASHFGASGIVFTLWGTIIGLAIFHKKPFFVIATLVLFSSYGLSFLFGLVPQDGVSFAGHFGGLLAGFACAKQISYNKSINQTSKKPE